MPVKLSLEKVEEITLDNFERSSAKERVVTLITPLSEWDEKKRRGIFMGIETDIKAEGGELKTLTVNDVGDEKKVGTSVGTFATKVHADLKDGDEAGPNTAHIHAAAGPQPKERRAGNAAAGAVPKDKNARGNRK